MKPGAKSGQKNTKAAGADVLSTAEATTMTTEASTEATTEATTEEVKTTTETTTETVETTTEEVKTTTEATTEASTEKTTEKTTGEVDPEHPSKEILEKIQGLIGRREKEAAQALAAEIAEYLPPGDLYVRAWLAHYPLICQIPDLAGVETYLRKEIPDLLGVEAYLQKIGQISTPEKTKLAVTIIICIMDCLCCTYYYFKHAEIKSFSLKDARDEFYDWMESIEVVAPKSEGIAKESIAEGDEAAETATEAATEAATETATEGATDGAGEGATDVVA